MTKKIRRHISADRKKQPAKGGLRWLANSQNYSNTQIGKKLHQKVRAAT
jgi:hypothetical protein